LPGRLGRQPHGGELAQLVVDEWQQLARGAGVAGLDGGQDPGDLGHSAECNSYGPQRNGKSVAELTIDLPQSLRVSAAVGTVPIARTETEPPVCCGRYSVDRVVPGR